MNKNPKHEHLTQYKWQPGQSGNKTGRPKAYQTILKELGYTRPMIAVMVAEIMFLSEREVRKIYDSETEPIIRSAIAKAFLKANYNGEYRYIEPYLKILFGRPAPFIPEPPIEDKGTKSI